VLLDYTPPLMSMPSTYRTIATLLWLVVAVLTAATITTLWHLPARQQVFFYVAGVGLVLLVSLNRWRQRQTLLPQKLMSGIIEQLPPPPVPELKEKAPAVTNPTQTPAPLPKATAATAIPEPLNAAEARKWLDEFLVKQQQS
jgi:hypothetical protein